MNKHKIINDPVYGFISIPYEIIFDLMEHPFFQRLRRIQQLGLTSLVYPGAVHSRFHHTVGSVHLMAEALKELKQKGINISEKESEAVTIAILLHDIGHAPFSHALEETLLPVSHEAMSLRLMKQLNKEFNGELQKAIDIFNDTYPKKFLHQLVSSQLDMDRLDYLNRDSFFTGVAEGVIGYDRIIKMLSVKNDTLVVEEKAIYSIEKFIVSRRLMYWQVYLHRTVLAAEQMLVKILKRAKEISLRGKNLFSSPSLKFFLENNFLSTDLNDEVINHFANLDDHDIYCAIKVWQANDDDILSYLCDALLNRRLFNIELQSEKFSEQRIAELKEKIKKQFSVSDDELNYFFISDSTSNNAYNKTTGQIFILMKTGEVKDIALAADHLNISALSAPVVKYFLSWVEEVK